MRFVSAFLCLLLLPFFCLGKRIEVRNQEDFDRLPLSLEAVLASSDTLADVRIGPGRYFYHEGHIRLQGIDRSGFHLRMTGENAILVAESADTTYDLGIGYVDLEQGCHVDVRGPVKQAGCWPIPVPFSKDLYMIRCDEPDLAPEESRTWSIILSQWFKGAVYPVVRISKGWLFFRKDQDYGTGMWSELRFGRCLPRYILCRDPRREDLHPCGSSNFLSVRDCRMGGLSVRNISFLGNRTGDCLFRLDRLSASQVLVSGCHFSGIRSDVICSEETSHLMIADCMFKENYLSAIVIGEGGSDIRIIHNRFFDNGLMMSNAPVVLAQGKEYRIADNYFEDFSYAAIRIGIHYTMPDRYGTTGVVENNEICMSSSFRTGIQRALIDDGAIYVSTINASATIRGNYIHDINGPHGNRGIFADDGVVNVEICDNRIFHIWNGYCIDLRKCFRVGRSRRSQISRPNVGNKIHDNLCDGKMRIYVRKDDPHSYVSGNIVMGRL